MRLRRVARMAPVHAYDVRLANLTPLIFYSESHMLSAFPISGEIAGCRESKLAL